LKFRYPSYMQDLLGWATHIKQSAIRYGLIAGQNRG
jgi:hypothetical protein